MTNINQGSFIYQNRKAILVILVLVLLGIGWNYWMKPEANKEYREIRMTISDSYATINPLIDEASKIITTDNLSFEQKQRYVEIYHTIALEGQILCRNLRNKKSSFKHLPDEYLDKLDIFVDAWENYSNHCAKMPNIEKENSEKTKEAISNWFQEYDDISNKLDNAEEELLDCEEKYGFRRRSK
ncbi:MAG: hypothetical protein K6C40_12340 [Thermoguttaceae bacterium]|nr:hypothetical protein [Thermoguttaceae bacterium]